MANFGPTAPWTGLEKIVFRFFFLYFGIQALPLDGKFFQYLFSVDWLHLHFRDIFYLSRYAPRFFPGPDTLANWAVVALIAAIGTVVWSLRDRERPDYRTLLYGLRVILRYRLAIGVIAYGFLKLFPMQAPLPSISNLNTSYGDFNAWKLFALSLGIVPSYESFLGAVEITGGLLLLHRRTTTLATLLILPFAGNVFMSNLAYEGGEYVYSLYLIAIALFLLSFDALRLYRLFTLEQPTLPDWYKPSFPKKWQQGRLVVKGAFIFLILLYGYKTYGAYQQGGYHYPQQPGLAKANGMYQVTEFRINDKTIPYSPTNQVRWKDVVFEKWATLSIRSNQPVQLRTTTTEEIYRRDEEKTYEWSGSTGRHYYGYQADTIRQILTLQNRNPSEMQGKWVLHYQRPTANRIILSGKDEKNNSLYVVLDKIHKKYLLEEVAREGRNKQMKL